MSSFQGVECDHLYCNDGAARDGGSQLAAGLSDGDCKMGVAAADELQNPPMSQ